MELFPARAFTYLTLVLLISTGCAVSEEIVEEVQETDNESPVHIDEPVSPIPDWYQSAVSSSADSVSLYGYAHTVAADLDDAVDHAKITAEKYLRFEIDRQLEKARAGLEASGYGPAGDSAFIIQLRNTAAEISFTQPAEVEIKHFLNEHDQNEIYARHRLPLSELYSVLEYHLSDQQFLEKIREGG